MIVPIILIVASSAVVLWCLIYPLTDYYARLFAPRVLKKGNASDKKICLTFDDGPDPLNTPELLEILQTANIPAAFFLVGEKAERFPGLVAAIAGAGHEIGGHTYYHRHSYLMFLKKSLATIIKGGQVLERITGKSPIFFRPPWGALNIFQYLLLKKMGLIIVLWTANARDWDIRTTPAQIIGRLQRRAGSGSIVVLHDSGGDPGAPRNMLNALPDLIACFKADGYRFVSLQDIYR